jgi:hypothetical protein
MSIFRSGRVVAPGLLLVGLAVAAWPAAGLSAQAPAQAPKTAPPPRTAPAVPAAKAPAPAVGLPSARSIINRHIEAMGGRNAILAHTSSHASGTVTIAGAGISGPLEVYSAKPDRSLVKISLGGIGDIIEAFDGTHGWSLQPMTGPRVAEGKELQERKFDSDFYGDLHQEGRYVSMTTVEKTTFEGRPCYKVSLVRKDGGEDVEFYDAETGLKAGATGTRETPMGPMTVTQVLSDYKKFGSLLVPTLLKQTAMGADQITKITAIEFDNVPPSTFDPPAQIKALVK